uniref:Protein kinase n=1 Tax=Rhizophora mucronata TaxID=61149 RepID=A0A2P2L4C1_RHIMU
MLVLEKTQECLVIFFFPFFYANLLQAFMYGTSKTFPHKREFCLGFIFQKFVNLGSPIIISNKSIEFHQLIAIF